MRKLITVGALLAAVALSASGASAAVTFDQITGTGFVGKGDVQLVYGWNNHQLQANAANVSFSYSSEDKYSAVCTFTTGEGTRGERIHNISHKRTAQVNNTVERELRKNKLGDVTGFTLTGYGAQSSSGSVPVLGGPCQGNSGHGGEWTSVEQTGSSGGLFVHYLGGAGTQIA